MLRGVGVALVGGIALFCIALLAVRYVAFPRLEAHRDDIAAMLSRELSQPVEIDAIDTGWDGWNPEIRVRGLRVRDRAQARTVPLLELPIVTGVVSWTSIPLFELRLRELTIENPRLSIRRDVDGRLHVAGIELDPAAAGDDRPLVDWLLKQRLIAVRDALVSWNDDRRNAPQLVLDRVQFRLENRFGHHRFGLTGEPPEEIAAPLDLRGEFNAASLADWRDAYGQLYVRLDYADVAAWREWLPFPVDVETGKGALRLWFDFAEGSVSKVVADLELADVRTRLGTGLAPVDLDHLAGRIVFEHQGDRRAFSARDLRFAAADGQTLQPVDFSLRYLLGADGRTTSGEADFERLELAPLSALATRLPLPEGLRADLVRHAPRGTLVGASYRWEGAADAPVTFSTKGEIHELGLNAAGALPGITGLSGAFDATEAGGSLKLGSRNLALSLPQVFDQPVALDSATARIRWTRDDALAVQVDDFEFANAHAAGSAAVSWRSRPKGPGAIDLTAKITRADVQHLPRYLPKVLSAGLREWLAASVRKGTSNDARFVLKGDLADFPFVGGRNGQFLVDIKGRDAELDYADGWPAITGIDAEVLFQNESLTVTATRGRVFGVALGRTTATIPDLTADHPMVTVAGEASGPTPEFLAFVQKSPVAGWIDHATDTIEATGNGRLALKLEMPLDHDHAPTRVAGDYLIAGNQIRMPGVPLLSQVNGRLSFTDSEIAARDVALETLGGPARLSLATIEGRVRVDASGNARLAAVRSTWPTRWLDRVGGSADWQIAIDVRPEFSTWVLDSSLRGATVELPSPLGKHADDALPLRIERRASARGADRDQIRIDYGRAARVVADRRLPAGGDAVIERALLTLGETRKDGEPDRAGVVVRGGMPSLDVDEWLEVARSPASTTTAGAANDSPTLASIDLALGEMVAAGRRLHDVRLDARRNGEDWRFSVTSKELEGGGSWQGAPAGATRGSGRLVAQFARLSIPDESNPSSDKPAGSEHSPDRWPTIDLVAERYIGKRGELGRLELRAKPDGNDWRIEKLKLSNEAGAIEADGWWRARARPQTKLDVAVDVRDSGAFLGRFGLPDAVRAAPTKIEGQLAWNAPPSDFDYPTLTGTFRVNVGAGQFTRIEPGIGKLLGVLSLQALPRRITLDFRDVFSEGFAFDSIGGSVRITQGVLHTDSLLLSGPAARVTIAGEADLEHETQKLTVRVQPSLATSVSAGAGAAAMFLLAANPVVGAAVGAGTLLAQKVMKDPIEQIFSYEYAVQGTWSDPIVERLPRRTDGPGGFAAPNTSPAGAAPAAGGAPSTAAR